MLKINKNNRVNAKDIYSFVEVKTQFNKWVERCIDSADLKINKDFWTFLTKSTGGRPATEYEFTIQAAKEVCIVSATKKAKELRRWLISISEQKENLDLLTHDQVVLLSVLKGFFRYVENQKDWLKKHLDFFVSNNIDLKNPYPEFHIWRNKMLNINPSEIEKYCKEYALENRKQINKKLSKHDIMNVLDSYSGLRNAVFDFLNIKGEVNSVKLANLVRRMAEAEGQVIYNVNESDLFRQKENLPDIKKLM